MFNQNQIEVLNSQLDNSRIKTREIKTKEKGNINLSYLEGFDIIETANSIFGYGNWSSSILKLEQVSQELNQNDNTVICYKAIVKVIVYDELHQNKIQKVDVGFGTGVSKALADAHENAGKEAVTDALKRAMRNFGNQFGNSLYDKSRNHINQDSSYQQNQNYNQRPALNNHQHQQPYQNPKQIRNIKQNNSSFNQYEYQSLFNLGLNIMEQNGFLVVTGENQYAYKDSIKACGFRFDAKSKTWYKVIEQGAA